jgi:hypothetical protein
MGRFKGQCIPLDYRYFVSGLDFGNVECWGSQLRAAHPAQQKLQLQTKDVAGFFLGLKPNNLIDTCVRFPKQNGNYCLQLVDMLFLRCCVYRLEFQFSNPLSVCNVFHKEVS